MDSSPNDKPEVSSEEQAAEARRSMIDRVENLRVSAKRDPGLNYLLDESLTPPPVRRSRRPWMFAGAAGGVLAVAAAVLLVVVPGGGSSPASADAKATPTTAQAPTSTPAPTFPVSGAVRPSATAKPGSAQNELPEGAIPAPAPTDTPPVPAPRMITPVRQKGRITDRFGTSRGDGYVHSGVDMTSDASPEFDVNSSCDGSVAGIDHSQTLGDFVVVDCGSGWRTVYAQMHTITAKPGDFVAAGLTVLGRAQGFVHFEVRWSTMLLDPQKYADFSPPPDPTPTPAATNTPTATATPRPGTSVPSNPGGDGGNSGGSSGGDGSTPTPPPPPTATSTPTPTPIPPTATPTATPTPRPPKKTATPPPIFE